MSSQRLVDNGASCQLVYAAGHGKIFALKNTMLESFLACTNFLAVRNSPAQGLTRATVPRAPSLRASSFVRGDIPNFGCTFATLIRSFEVKSAKLSVLLSKN